MIECAWCEQEIDGEPVERPGTWTTAAQATWAYREPPTEPPPLLMHPDCAAEYDQQEADLAADEAEYRKQLDKGYSKGDFQ